MKILVICSGNICRSPMAAEYLRHRASLGGLPGLVVDSAGTLGITGAPASDAAIVTLEEFGLDLTGHRSRALSESLARSADVIIGMAREHRAFLDEAYPGLDNERWLLRCFEHGATPRAAAPDLADPIGTDLEFYRTQFDLIRRCVDHLVAYLEQAGPGGERV